MSQQTNDEAFAKLLKELEEEPKTEEELIYDEYDEYAIIITQFVLKHLLKKEEFSGEADRQEAISKMLEFDDELREIVAKTQMPEHQVLLEMLAVAEKYIKKYN